MGQRARAARFWGCLSMLHHDGHHYGCLSPIVDPLRVCLFDALVIGYYEDGKLLYAARTRNGFTPASRAELFKKFKPLETRACPFANLPEKKAGRWGAGLTAAKMEECRWLKPVLVAQFEFVEWTEDAHLRHSRFVALRDDKKAKDVRREA